MIKDTLLFLWIFIFPIFTWMNKSFFPKKKIKVPSSQNRLLKFFLFMEVLLYGFGLPSMLSWGGNFKETLNMFCMFQIVALDMYFSFLLVVNWWDTLNFPKKLAVLKGYKLFILMFFEGVLWCLSLSFSMLFVFFRLISLWEIFTKQEIPLSFVICILLFNPIYMFYQLKERLFKND